MVLDETVETYLEQARQAAGERNDLVMGVCLDVARGLAKEAGQDITPQVAEIEKGYYANIVSLELKIAKHNAGDGDTLRMNKSLERAQMYAQKAGQDIRRQVAEIEKVGYTTAVPSRA